MKLRSLLKLAGAMPIKLYATQNNGTELLTKKCSNEPFDPLILDKYQDCKVMFLCLEHQGWFAIGIDVPKEITNGD